MNRELHEPRSGFLPRFFIGWALAIACILLFTPMIFLSRLLEVLGVLKSRPPAQITDESVGAPFWLDLAELFFLDFEPDESDFENLAERLQRSGISRNLALKILTEEVAPVAGVNLGFGLYPTIGEWSGFGPGLREGIAVSVGSPFRQVLVMSRIGIWLHRLFFRNLVEILGWSRLERHLEQGGS